MDGLVASAGVEPSRDPSDPDRDRARALPARRRRRSRAAARTVARARRPTRSSSARSRRTASASATGRSRRRSRARTSSSDALELARQAIPELVVLLTGPARGYVRRELDRRGMPYVHRLLPDSRRRSPAPTTRSMPTSSRRARRAAPRACSSRWRRACRSSRPAPGRPRTSSSTARTGSSSRSRTPTASLRGLVRVHGDRHARRRAARSRQEDGGRANAHERARPRAGRSSWTASSPGGAVQMDTGRVGRYAARARAGRGCCVRGQSRAGASRLLRLGPRPRPGRAGRRWDREAAEARRAIAEQPDRLLAPLPRHRRSSRATSGRCSRYARRRRARSSSTRTASPTPGWAGDRTDELNVPLRRASSAADHVVYQSAF